MADSPGKVMFPTFEDHVEKDDFAIAAKGIKAVAISKIINSKRIYPTIPAEKTIVFIG